MFASHRRFSSYRFAHESTPRQGWAFRADARGGVRIVIRQNVTIALGLKNVFLLTTILGATGLWTAVIADTGATPSC